MNYFCPGNKLAMQMYSVLCNVKIRIYHAAFDSTALNILTLTICMNVCNFLVLLKSVLSKVISSGNIFPVYQMLSVCVL